MRTLEDLLRFFALCAAKGSMKKQSILAISDYANTGIGESLRPQLKHWHNAGHDIFMMGLGYNGFPFAIDRDTYPYWDKIRPIFDTYSPEVKFGQQVIEPTLRASQANFVITSFDVGMIRYMAEPHQDPFTARSQVTMNALNVKSRSFQHIAYFPLDGLVADRTLPRHFEEVIGGFDIPVTYSQFAKDAIMRSIGLDIPMIPISHDPQIYRKMDKSWCRNQIGFPQKGFIVAMIGTNQSRKLWPEFIYSAGKLAKAHDDVYVLPWTTWMHQINGGFDVQDLCYRESIPSIQTIDPGIAVHRFTDEQMAMLYNAVDVLVLTTVGEGAGLPPIRARACGTPTLVSDNTSCTEFAADAFELVTSRVSYTDNGNNLVRYSTDVDELYLKLEELYASETLCQKIGDAAIEKSKNYTHDRCNAMWDELLEGHIR